MKLIRRTSLFLLGIFCLSACYDSVDNSITLAENPADTPVLITTAITGSVVDATNTEISDYQISIGDITSIVDGKRFLIQIENVNKKGQAIYVKDGDRIESMLHTQLIENDINLVELQMFDDMSSRMISGSGPNSIDISPNFSLQISADEIRDEQGNIPTQNVFMHYRDLSLLNNISQLGISAYSIEGSLRSTSHLGAFHIEARGEDGSPLLFSETVTASIHITDAGNNIALFHFDTVDERWQEVEALTQGENKIELQSTGLYTISKHTKAVYAEGDINKQDIKVSYQLMDIDGQSKYSTAGGKWITIIPAEKEIQIATLSPCKDEITTHSIPSTSINISGVDIEVTEGNYYKVQTVVYDCEGELEETTAIYLKDKNDIGSIYTFADNNLESWVSVCDSEFDISTYDIDTDHIGPAIPWSLDIAEDESFLVSCDQFEDGYSYIKIGNDKMVFPPFITSKVDEATTLHSIDDKIRFRFEGQVADSYPMEKVNVFLRDEFGNTEYGISCENSDQGCGFTNWNVTHYEAGSEKWVRVSFAGEVWMQTFNPLEAGYFDVEGVILTQAN